MLLLRGMPIRARPALFADLPSGDYVLSARSVAPVDLSIETPEFTVAPKIALSLSSIAPQTATATARIVDGTVTADAAVTIAATIGGPGALPSLQPLPALSGDTDTEVTFTFLKIAPGVWALDADAPAQNARGNPADIIMYVDTDPVTVAVEGAALVTLSAPATRYFGTDLTVNVDANGPPPASMVRMRVVATREDGAEMTYPLLLTPSDYRQTATFAGLLPGDYTFSLAPGHSTAIYTDGTQTRTTINPVTVSVAVTPAPPQFRREEPFSVTARVTTPSSYSGTVTLNLSGVGGTPRALTLTGNAAETADYGRLDPGEYTLHAAGTGIAPIAPIRLAAIAATVVVTPVIVDKDAEIQVAIVDGTTLDRAISVQLRLDSGRSGTVTLPAGIRNAHASLVFSDPGSRRPYAYCHSARTGYSRSRWRVPHRRVYLYLS